MFYAIGLALNLAHSKYFKEACAAVARGGAGYVPPTRKTIATTLLYDEVQSVDNSVSNQLSNTVNTGLTIISDGSSNVQYRPILITVTPEGSVFLGACDSSGEIKDAAYIAEKFCEQIEKVGAARVVQIIADSASNCVAARKLIAEKYPHITCAPCAAHCLDLLLEDIGKLPWVASVLDDGHNVVKFITIRQKSLALFRSHSKLELLKPWGNSFCHSLHHAAETFRVQRRTTRNCCISRIQTVASKETVQRQKNSCN